LFGLRWGKNRKKIQAKQQGSFVKIAVKMKRYFLVGCAPRTKFGVSDEYIVDLVFFSGKKEGMCAGAREPAPCIS
jgi:hypothetical protein